jgi:hypothetical protein
VEALLITGPQRAKSKINWPPGIAGPERAIDQEAVLELAIVLVEELPQAIDPVVAALERVLVAAEPELALVVAELERDQAAAEPELGQAGALVVLGHPRGRLAVVPRTKSVTAAHRRGLPLLAAEDLAAAVETLLVRVVAGAAAAWEAADSTAAEAEAVGAVAAGGDEGR